MSPDQETPDRFAGELLHPPLLQGHANSGDFRGAQADEQILRYGEVAVETEHSGRGNIGAEALRALAGLARDLDQPGT